MKPVNILELINWIGEHLNLEWTEQPNIKEISQLSNDNVLPSKEILNELLGMIDMGYVVGVRKLINEIVVRGISGKQFTRELSEMADNFELERMKVFIKEKLVNG